MFLYRMRTSFFIFYFLFRLRVETSSKRCYYSRLFSPYLHGSVLYAHYYNNIIFDMIYVCADYTLYNYNRRSPRYSVMATRPVLSWARARVRYYYYYYMYILYPLYTFIINSRYNVRFLCCIFFIFLSALRVFPFSSKGVLTFIPLVYKSMNFLGTYKMYNAHIRGMCSSGNTCRICRRKLSRSLFQRRNT